MVALITAIYLALNSIRVFSYIPQIIAVSKDESPAKAISLMTWTFWTLANLATALYASVVVPDFLLALMSYGNTLGCGIVVGIVIYKRKKYAIDNVVQSATDAIRNYASESDVKNLLTLK